MSKRFGKKRVPECYCTYNFTCGACLRAAGPTKVALIVIGLTLTAVASAAELGVLVKRDASSSGDYLVWSCTYQTSMGPRAVSQLKDCEPARVFP